MNLVSKSAEDAIIETLQRRADDVARLVHAAVLQMNEGYRELWNRPDDELVALLNALGPARVQLLFENNTTHGAALNALLDSMTADNPDLPLASRVALVPAREIAWNELEATFELAAGA